MDEQNVSTHELSQIIETDQAFTARILRLVNSPFYGFTRKIVSVEEAITMLGFNTIHQLLLTTSVLNSFNIHTTALNIHYFWQHSIGADVIAKHLLHGADKDTRNEAFMCGVLHDIGRLILVKMDPAKFTAFYSKSEMVTDLEAENKFFGIDHQKLGELLAQKWNFPESIVATIAIHHKPDMNSPHKKLIAAVNIADLLCHALSIGDSGSYYISEFSQDSWKALDIEMTDLEHLLKKALNDINKSDKIMGEFCIQ